MATHAATPAEAENLEPGQWVIDADGAQLCLVDTNVGWPQRMWMLPGGRAYIATDCATYPLNLMDLDEECPHWWGTQECGHCRRCGQVIEPPKDLRWNILPIGPDS